MLLKSFDRLACYDRVLLKRLGEFADLCLEWVLFDLVLLNLHEFIVAPNSKKSNKKFCV